MIPCYVKYSVLTAGENRARHINMGKGRCRLSESKTGMCRGCGDYKIAALAERSLEAEVARAASAKYQVR